MTDIDRLPEPGTALATDTELENAVGALLERAHTKRQVWLMFLDHEQRLTPVVMPCDDLPLSPEQPTPTHDLGTRSSAHVVAQRLRQLLDECDLAHVVLVWERIGGEGFTSIDRRWAQAMARESALVGAPLRAQFVLHSAGIRPITPDDYDQTD